MQRKIIWCALLAGCTSPERELLDQLSVAACDLASRCDPEYPRLYDDERACVQHTRAFLIDFGYDATPGAYTLDATHTRCLSDLQNASCEQWNDATALGRLLAPSCRETRTTQRSAALATLEALAPMPFEYAGPGSLGGFVDYHLHPSHPEVIIASGDPGGIYLSTDNGTSWENISLNLHTGSVWGLEFLVRDAGLATETTRLLLGTDSGVYTSNDVPSFGGLDRRAITGWTESGGFEVGDERPDEATSKLLSLYNNGLLTLPIGAVTVDPNDPQRVWVGITGQSNPNLQQSIEDGSGVQRFDKWKVYRSTDGGQSFEPVLRLSPRIAAFPQTPYDDDGNVFSILVSPLSSDNVWVATDRGLYGTSNATSTTDANGDGLADLSWTELAQPTRRTSTDGGLSWTTATAKCYDYKSKPTATAWCLPVVSSATVGYVIDPSTGAMGSGVETHPNLRELAASKVGSKLRLYATVWDRGHASDKGPGCSTSVLGDTFHDANLAFLRGGLYASDDGGETWRWLFTNTGAPGGAPATTAYLTELHYRCDSSTSQRTSNQRISFFPSASLPSNQKLKLAALLGSAGAEGGIYAYTPSSPTPWKYLTDLDSPTYESQFEGEQPLNISGTGPVGANKLIADWSQNTAGYPLVMFSARGILMGTWSKSLGSYTFVHMGSDYEGADNAGLSRWSGTGLDNAVVWDVIDVDGTLYLGISDGGVLKAEPAGDQLLYVGESRALWTPNWSEDPNDFRDDETRALAWDPDRSILYAGTFVNSSATGYAVFASDRTRWWVIGGYGYVSDAASKNLVNGPAYNGFYSGATTTPLETTALLPLPVGVGTDAELLAGTSRGLFSYARSRAAGAGWVEACAELAHGKAITGLAMDHASLPGWAFATLGDNQLGGLLAIHLTDLSCQTLSNASYLDPATGRPRATDPIRFPSAIALSVDATGAPRVVIGATYQSYPALFSAPIVCDTSCSVGTWSWPWTGRGVYEAGSPHDATMRRFEVGGLAVHPTNRAIVWAALETVPAYDYYNPQYLFASTDGGTTFTAMDFEDEDYNLPSRRAHVLRFSSDGAWLYAATRASLYRMPVVW